MTMNAHQITNDGQATQPLQAPAWHCKAGLVTRYTVGILRLTDGRLSFLTEKGTAFDVAVGEVADLNFSWGDSVMKCNAGGQKWRFYFSRPQGAPVLPGGLAGGAIGGLVAVGDTIAAVQGVKGIFDSRKVGKEFRAALAP